MNWPPSLLFVAVSVWHPCSANLHELLSLFLCPCTNFYPLYEKVLLSLNASVASLHEFPGLVLLTVADERENT